MTPVAGRYQVIDLPPARRETPIIDLYWWKHSVYGLLEVDVTVPRQFLADHKARTGESLSFTGYLAFCLARAVDEDRSVQAMLKGRKQMVVFEDVDVAMMVEREIGGTRAAMMHVIRHANHRSLQEIHQEIRSAQAQPVPPNKGIAPWLRFFMLQPWPLPKLFSALGRAAARCDPTLVAAMGGTVGVTAVGMFGQGISGWGLTPMPHSLDLVVGSIALKPAVVADRIEPREILNLTVVFDHDVIDGSPAIRFAQRLVELIESGYGLGEDQPIPALDIEPAAVRIAHVLV